jgi:L-aspartate oxidase
LAEARGVLDDVHAVVAPVASDAPAHELVNLLTVADAMLAGATAREESRGCHTREDFPATREAFRIRLVQ